MGVQTVMLAATLYGKSELEIPVVNLIIAILLIQLVAIPGAFGVYTGLITRVRELIWIVIGVLLMKVGNGTPANK